MPVITLKYEDAENILRVLDTHVSKYLEEILKALGYSLGLTLIRRHLTRLIYQGLVYRFYDTDHEIKYVKISIAYNPNRFKNSIQSIGVYLDEDYFMR